MKSFAFVLFLFDIYLEESVMYRRIRDLREDHDLSQTDVAKVLNCSQVCYSYYEIGRRDMPIDVLIVLAKYYDVSTDYILELTDDKKPSK